MNDTAAGTATSTEGEAAPAPAAPPAKGQVGRVWPWRAFDQLVVQKAIAARHERTLALTNPTPRFPGEPGLMTNISAGLHVYLPGESAPPHRHTSNALRIGLLGSGIVTLIDGKECSMGQGDLSVIPGWSWHEHEHRGSEPVVWLELLDVPLHEHLRTAAYEPGPPPPLPPPIADAAFASAGFVPQVAGLTPRNTPVYNYPWSAACAAVAAAPPGPDGARRVKYTNPLTGGSALPMLEAYAVQLAAGSETIPFRTSADAVCVVLEGSGSTRVGDRTLTWGPRDILTLPHRRWIAHQAKETARLIVVTDGDLLRRLDLLTEEYGGPLA